ncbi:MAG: four helix bundle protein [Planctomycetota bacterium]|jgi:four helix bundle protein
MTLTNRTHFAHERLDAFHAALELVEGVEKLAARIPTGHAHLKDQLRRSAAAALGNIVEGANRHHPRDKATRFTVAHGEAGECAGWLALVARTKLASSGQIDELLGIADRIGAMTHGLARTSRSRAP